MITVNGDWFALETANTGYYLGVRGGLVENLHYGARVRVENSVPLREKTDIGYGGDVVYRAARVGRIFPLYAPAGWREVSRRRACLRPGAEQRRWRWTFPRRRAWLSRCFIPCTRTATSSRGAFV